MSRNNWLIVAALVLLIAAAVVLVNVRGVNAAALGTGCENPSTQNWLPRATLHSVDAGVDSVTATWSAASSVRLYDGTMAHLEGYKVVASNRRWIPRGAERDETSEQRETWEYSDLRGPSDSKWIRVEVQPCYKWKYRGVFHHSVSPANGLSVCRPGRLGDCRGSQPH